MRAWTMATSRSDPAMTPFAYHIAAGPLPFIPAGSPLTQQALAAVGEGTWVDFRTLEIGVSWENA